MANSGEGHTVACSNCGTTIEQHKLVLHEAYCCRHFVRCQCGLLIDKGAKAAHDSECGLKASSASSVQKPPSPDPTVPAAAHGEPNESNTAQEPQKTATGQILDCNKNHTQAEGNSQANVGDDDTDNFSWPSPKDTVVSESMYPGNSHTPPTHEELEPPTKKYKDESQAFPLSLPSPSVPQAGKRYAFDVKTPKSYLKTSNPVSTEKGSGQTYPAPSSPLKPEQSNNAGGSLQATPAQAQTVTPLSQRWIPVRKEVGSSSAWPMPRSEVLSAKNMLDNNVKRPVPIPLNGSEGHSKANVMATSMLNPKDGAHAKPAPLPKPADGIPNAPVVTKAWMPADAEVIDVEDDTGPTCKSFQNTDDNTGLQSYKWEQLLPDNAPGSLDYTPYNGGTFLGPSALYEESLKAALEASLAEQNGEGNGDDDPALYQRDLERAIAESLLTYNHK